MPKSLEFRAEDMARDVMRRSAVTRASCSERGSGVWGEGSLGAGIVDRPARTKLRPIERRSSSLV